MAEFNWQKLIEDAMQIGSPLYNEQGTTQGVNQWWAQDPTLGGVDIVQDGDKKYAVYGRKGMDHFVQALGSDNQPLGQPEWVQGNNGWKGWAQDAAKIGSLAAGAFFAPAMAGAMGMTGAAGGAAGLGGGSGAFLGEGVLSGVPAWDAAGAGLGLGGGAAGAGSGAFLGEGMASGVPAWDAAATSAGLPLNSTAGSSLVKGAGELLGSGAGKLVGGLLGAAAGAQKQEGEQATNQRALDPRLDARLFGPGGAVESADEWRNANKSGQNQTMIDAQEWLRTLLQKPQVGEGIAQMGGRGMGLMSQPVAGNPFLNWKY